jgi:hypothetical protein
MSSISAKKGGVDILTPVCHRRWVLRDRISAASEMITSLPESRGEGGTPDRGVSGNEDSVLAGLGKEGKMGSVMSTDSYAT